MSKYVIETENLRNEYNGHAVVDSLSLHVPEGRILRFWAETAQERLRP